MRPRTPPGLDPRSPTGSEPPPTTSCSTSSTATSVCPEAGRAARPARATDPHRGSTVPVNNEDKLRAYLRRAMADLHEARESIRKYESGERDERD
ncbi:polyketide synthase docking domain-containing protein, partial [Streptomyces sp. ACA25]|uniref:polyketide synthase docking domain-containing protein n=1 Tax=Streptomyces sp. ACA25 TaxID=3022596 RepID=UPI003FA7E65F